MCLVGGCAKLIFPEISSIEKKRDVRAREGAEQGGQLSRFVFNSCTSQAASSSPHVLFDTVFFVFNSYTIYILNLSFKRKQNQNK